MAGSSATTRTARIPRPSTPWHQDGDGPYSAPGAPKSALATPDCHDSKTKRKNLEKWSVCWLISAIVNLLILLTAAIFLIPLDRGGGPFTLIARLDAEEGELETLTESADTVSLDFGVAPELPKPETIKPPEVRVDLSMAGGSLGQGPGGWQGGPGSGGSGGGTEYFGTVAYGNRFVYILDKSGSMNEGGSDPSSSDNRFARARYELLRSVDQLAPYQQFYVILFSDNSRRMFDDESPAPMTIPATRQNKQRLREWLEAASPGGGTDPREALFLALSIAPDAVFLLSDGDFDEASGKKNRLFAGEPEAEELVERFNHDRTPIHTFAYENPNCKQRMENLAQLSGGDYKYIAPRENVGREHARARRRR